MKILGIGKNYVTNKSEIANIKDGYQLIFLKADSTLVTDNKDIKYPSDISDKVAYEVELVAKIGKAGKNISATEAASYISEFAIGIDFTAKNLITASKEKNHPWVFGKGFDGASPISNFKPISDFPDLNDVNFDLKINGELAQIGNTDFMIYSFGEILAYISKYMTLNPGDLIFTGTPADGIGLINKGDHLQASIEGEVLLDFKMI
ncbi:fumarylacetoacetate hydrolase family protein [Seonamhaeicola sp. MEBiC1930]|uniref:fumarylacetoacetate hydrolase family protein n=1 Tax=Seonamhaeicola sp. MEBiC01930 TaxID=2976768 RepID=UPI003250A60D